MTMSRTPSSTSPTGEVKLKPTISPTTTITAIDSRLVRMSATVRPATTAHWVIGSERKRSMRPRLRSSVRLSAVTKPPNAIDCTTMPGIRKSV